MAASCTVGEVILGIHSPSSCKECVSRCDRIEKSCDCWTARLSYNQMSLKSLRSRHSVATVAQSQMHHGRLQIGHHWNHEHV